MARRRTNREQTGTEARLAQIEAEARQHTFDGNTDEGRAQIAAHVERNRLLMERTQRTAPQFPQRIQILLPVGAMKLLAEPPWMNRFQFRSSSGRTYRIAQHQTNRHWGCSCPGWINRKTCRHLTQFGLLPYEQPCEAIIFERHEQEAAERQRALDAFENDYAEARRGLDRRSERFREQFQGTWDPEEERVNRMQANLERQMIEQRHGLPLEFNPRDWFRVEDTPDWRHCFGRMNSGIAIAQHATEDWWACNCHSFHRDLICSHLTALRLPGYKEEAIRRIIADGVPTISGGPGMPDPRSFNREGDRGTRVARVSFGVDRAERESQTARIVYGDAEAPPGRPGETMLRLHNQDPARNGMHVMTPGGWQRLGDTSAIRPETNTRPVAPAKKPAPAEPPVDQLILDEDDI